MLRSLDIGQRHGALVDARHRTEAQFFTADTGLTGRQAQPTDLRAGLPWPR